MACLPAGFLLSTMLLEYWSTGYYTVHCTVHNIVRFCAEVKDHERGQQVLVKLVDSQQYLSLVINSLGNNETVSLSCR